MKCSFVDLDKMCEKNAEYVVDTNVATFVLDGELWGREPATLMRGRPEVVAAYRLAREVLDDVPAFYEPLKRSIAAFEWLKRTGPKVVLPLTVQTELSVAGKVSAKLSMCMAGVRAFSLTFDG